MTMTRLLLCTATILVLTASYAGVAFLDRLRACFCQLGPQARAPLGRGGGGG
jgi:hypothetical protein